VKTALIGAAAIWFIGLRREQAARLRNVIDSNANADGPAGSHADSLVDVPVAEAVDDDERIAATSSTQSVMQSVTQPVASTEPAEPASAETLLVTEPMLAAASVLASESNADSSMSGAPSAGATSDIDASLETPRMQQPTTSAGNTAGNSAGGEAAHGTDVVPESRSEDSSGEAPGEPDQTEHPFEDEDRRRDRAG